MKNSAEKNFIKYSFFLFCILTAVSWIYIFSNESEKIFSLMNKKNLEYLGKFIKRLFGMNEEVPAFMNMEMWKEGLILSMKTFEMSVLATGIASLGMLLLVIPSPSNIANGKLTLHKRWYYRPFYYVSKTLFLIMRAIPELMWAMILVFILKPGVLPGAFALALHNMGVLGKLCGEIIEDMNEKPVQNMALNGASQGQLMFYAILPDILPKYINYILYRMENIIRATIIVGFVGAGGLGLQFKLAMSHFKYSEILLYLIYYLLLVYFTDILSEIAKKWIKA